VKLIFVSRKPSWSDKDLKDFLARHEKKLTASGAHELVEMIREILRNPRSFNEFREQIKAALRHKGIEELFADEEAQDGFADKIKKE
jgi:hypothetical protein